MNRWIDRWLAGAAVLLACLVIAHQWTFISESNLLTRALQNSLHVPAFAVLSYFLAASWKKASVIVVLAISLSVALVLESAQIFSARDASLMDLGSDILGSLLGVWVARGSRVGQVCGTAVLVLVTVWAPLHVWRSYLERDRNFPVLMDAGSASSKLFSSNSDVSITQIEDGGREMLRVCWSEVQYPGVQMVEVVPDWSAFETFHLEFEIEPAAKAAGEGAVQLTVAVGHSGVPGTSVYVPEDFPPGWHRWEIARNALDKDAATISHLIIHSSPEHAGRCIRIARAFLD